jgi:hypothetical protein
MDAGASEASEPSPAPEPDPRRRAHSRLHRLSLPRLRIPTALLVTVVGIVLSAWLLPALTRQWDDRQKANELKVALVSDIAAASANAIGDAGQIRAEGDRSLRARAVRAWAVATLELESRLRAYYPPELVVKWRVFSYAIDRYLGRPVDASFGDSRVFDPISVRAWLLEDLPETTTGESIEVTDVMAALLDVDDSSAHRFLTSDERGVLRDAKIYGGGRTLSLQAAYRELGSALTGLHAAIISDVLHGHPAGYSTTKRDLIHDLLPL